ncbi:NAD(P)H-hydrate epimerase [Patescibacteria group bacterium AH-259-L05]|nr:NAD(P)H-hydrate epimerase [Patescibacteria group bacterium AH-259-L05]
MYYAAAQQMAKLDDLAIKNGLEIRQMMELAGWQMLNLFRHGKIPKKSKIMIVCGKGNQAGDGLCAGRHLANSGYKVNFVLVSKNMSPDSVHHLQLIKKMKLSLIYYPNNKAKAKKLIQNSDIIIDALIGYNLSGAPRKDFKELVEFINQSKGKIISYDIPTGIDSTAGECFSPCIKAWITLSLALPKQAFRRKQARKACGKIFVADIGIPSFIYNKIAVHSRPSFERYKNGLVPL